MNKYQEALTKLASIDLQVYGEDRFGDGRLTPLYACDCYREEFTILQELADKEEKNRWHDLRKNPDDLPEENTRVLVVYKFWEKCASYTVARLVKRTYSNVWIEHGNAEFSSGMVLAWKYIEKLKNE